MDSILPDNNKPLDVDDLIALKRVQSVAASPCGTWAAVALERLDQDGSGYTVDIWKIALDNSRKTQQLTRGKHRDHSPCFRRDGSLGFLSNRPDSDAKAEEDEPRNQIWLLPPGGGEASRLTDEPLGVSAFRFARDADTLLLLTPVLPGVAHEAQRESANRHKKHGPSALHYKTMPVRFWDHWLQNARTHLVVIDSNGRRDLTPNADRELHEVSFDIAADGQLAVATWASLGPDRVHDVGLMLFDLAKGSERLISPEPLTALSHPLFNPDASIIACQIEIRPERTCHSGSLRLIDVASGTLVPLAASWNAWPTPQAWDADGSNLFVTADETGHVPVFQIELSTGDIMRLTETGSHSQVCLHREMDQGLPSGYVNLLGIRSDFGMPPEVFHLPLTSAEAYDAMPVLSGFDPARQPFVVENLSVLSSDGHPVQAFLLKPTNRGEPPLPLLLWIHGGPIHAWGDGWHWRWNPLLALAQGYAVLLPNPRGSTGFGQAFIDGIWNNQWGQQCYEDLMAVVDQVAQRPDIDPARMAAMGGSFGGYMTNWIGTQTTRFKCLITHASVYAMSSFTGVTDLPAYWLLEMGGEPYSDPVAFDRYSPSRLVAQWKSPTLIIHGELDYRVPISEGLALFEALQYHGVESELLVFPDENHWILRPNNSVVWYRTVFDFLQRHLTA
jgi:dipeptidyl aminopeptidase/acylaminoacyl peptidase